MATTVLEYVVTVKTTVLVRLMMEHVCMVVTLDIMNQTVPSVSSLDHLSFEFVLGNILETLMLLTRRKNVK